MKVTVTFGRTGVVVPCREGWTVRDLIQQATRRFTKTLEQQEGHFLVHTHHLEYCDGGILDPDDLLAEVVEDKDKLIAVYEEQEALRRGAASPQGGHVTGPPGPDSRDAKLPIFEPVQGEIEVNISTLKSETPLVVRRSSDSALRPSARTEGVQPKEPGCWPVPTGMSHLPADRGGLEDGRRDPSTPSASKITLRSLTRTVEISGEHGSLGIHVVPYFSSLNGRVLGLLIRSVEENSRTRREGIFQEDECIVKINEMPLMDKTFARSEEIFRGAMQCPTVRLEVLSTTNRECYEKGLIRQLPLRSHSGVPKVKASHITQVKLNEKRFDPESKASYSEVSRTLEGMTSAAPHQVQSSPTPKGNSEALLLKSHSVLSPRASFANKKGGKRLKINLKKGPEGLGFTVVTRDSTLHGAGPILVKNILPRGAAVKDGRLQSGDWILEVNGVDITGHSQEELVTMLRSTKQGDSVSLVVVRQEDVFLPRELKGEQASTQLPEEGTEPLVLEIPLNDSGSAGLGVSLKGNKSRETGEDLGIFIKSIIHGGAAYKDGRLRVNDQLIAVNGESLLSKSNHEAMDTLRRSMSTEGNLRGTIQLLVMRATEQRGQVGAVGRHRRQTVTGMVPSDPRDPVQPPMVSNSIYETSGAAPMRLPKSSLSFQMKAPWDTSWSGPLCPLIPCNPGAAHPNPASLPTIQRRRTPIRGVFTKPVASNYGIHKSRGSRRVRSPLRVDGARQVKPLAKDLGPTLGLKKSSSLESLQTPEVTKAQGSFPKPQPHMVRGRCCNESFRAAIDKSYDGPPGIDDDNLSNLSSGQETPASSSSRQEVGDVEDGTKDKKKKGKDTSKSKGKDGGKKKMGDAEEQDKKARKKGFGLLRFGRSKEEKAKVEVKHKLEGLSEVELDRMKDDKERTKAQQPNPDLSTLPSLEEDESDPNYARIDNFDNFRNRLPAAPSPHRGDQTPAPPAVPGPPSPEEHVEGLYSRVNKQRPAVANSEPDRIQQLRREHKQAWRGGAVPTSEEPETPSPSQDCGPHRRPNGCGTIALTRFCGLPCRWRPPDPQDYLLQTRDVPRDAAKPRHPGYPPRDNYQPRGPEQRTSAARPGDIGQHLPAPQPRSPLRQDAPPLPLVPLRSTRYESMNRGRLDRFVYMEEQHQDPQQKNPVTAAV
ncbi:partitioning defective 3 homolog B-like [Arapaima gigas]